MNHMIRTVLFVVSLMFMMKASHATDGWYTEGNFTPGMRIPVILNNPLDIDRTDCPVTIRRENLPYRNISLEWITVVDPSLPPNPKPTIEDFRERGASAMLHEEANGHHVLYQQDGLDKDTDHGRRRNVPYGDVFLDTSVT